MSTPSRRPRSARSLTPAELKAIDKEWRRLLARLRRKGAVEAAKYVALRIRKEGYPLWFPYQLVDYLIKRGEIQAAGIVLMAVRRSGQTHVVFDELYGRWLWSQRARTRAIRFTEKKAKYWSHPRLYNQLSAMYQTRAITQKNKKMTKSLLR